MDLSIYETGDGGDLVLKGNDLETSNGLFNLPYLAMFGGNVAQSTPIIRDESEEAIDWWANSLLFQETPELQMNSKTERALKEFAVNSAGRVKIEQIIKRDIEFMQKFAGISVSVTLENVDTINIKILLQEPNPSSIKEFIFIWNATKQELINDVSLGGLGIYVPLFINFEPDDFEINDFL